MKKQKFKAALQSGHKENAVEVPFDPAEVWGVDPQPLWKGRRSHRVQGTVNGVSFAGRIVPRSKKFYLLIDEELERKTGITEGDVIEVAVEAIRR
jgi:Domain of unknown function (DUF1905)